MKDHSKEIKSFLLHLGNNMWCEWLPEELMTEAVIGTKRMPDFTLAENETIWRKTTAKLAERGMNMAVIDVGEALAYPSHPELAVKGSWSPEKMRAEVARLKAIGIEAIPKLNFSATHDGWLKDYHRMLSTPEYYRVVSDTIRDAIEAFDHPRFIHLGFDEERAEWMRDNNYYVARQGELWWHDFLYTVGCAEKWGARPWVWADCGPHKPEYTKRCPKSVLQTAWYYDAYNAKLSMDPKVNPHYWKLQNFIDLDRAGFDQVPCGTNWIGFKRRAMKVDADEVMGLVVKFVREHADSDRMLGFMMAPWATRCTTDEKNEKNMRGIDIFAEALAQNS
jgi:hypothetical protein